MVKSTKKSAGSGNSGQSDEVRTFVGMLESSCPIRLSTSLHFFRRAFANGPDVSDIVIREHFHARIKNGVLKALRSRDLDIDAQINAVWIITNMCCISQQLTHDFVTARAVDTLTEMLRSPNARLAHQTVWAIANIAADCLACKVVCRKRKLMRILAKKLKETFEEPSEMMMLGDLERRNIVWCINNIVSGGRIDIQAHIARQLIRTLSNILMNEEATKRMKGPAMLMWTMSNLIDNTADTTRIDMLLAMPDVLPHILSTFLDARESVSHPAALRLVGNVAVGNDTQTDRLLEQPLFRAVMNSAMHSSEHRSEAAWIWSNVAAGAPRHVDFMLDDHDKFNYWLQSGINSKERRFRKECLWIVGNLLATADEHQRAHLATLGLVHHLPPLLTNSDARLNEKAATSSVELLREHPWLLATYKRLDILGALETTDDEQFSMQKAELKGLLEELEPSKRRAPPDAECHVICYSKPDPRYNY